MNLSYRVVYIIHCALQVAQKAADKAKKDSAEKEPVNTKEEPEANKVRPV